MSRKSRKSCANPMFLLWLEEWQKDAEEKGLNSKWTYSKAISSIKKYPLPLRSGKEAKILENIGDGIAKKLDQRLAEYLDSGGDYKSLHQMNTSLQSPCSPPKKIKKNILVNASSGLSLAKPFDGPQCSAADGKTKQYIPKFRSGAYALLVTIYEESQKSSYVGYLLKQELQKKAQHLCDKSFTLPDSGSRYTAWSSMRKLIEKGYITKVGSPAKYHITSSGCELSQLLLRLNNVLSSVQSNDFSNKNSYGTLASQSSKVACKDQFLKESCLQLSEGIGASLSTTKLFISNKNNYSKHCSPLLNEVINIEEEVCIEAACTEKDACVSIEKLRYWYISENNEKTLIKSKALVTVDDDFGLGFLIKVKLFELEASGALFKLDLSRPSEGDFHFVMISDNDCRDVAVPPADCHEAAVSNKKANQNKHNIKKDLLLPIKEKSTALKFKDTMSSKVIPKVKHNTSNSSFTMVKSSTNYLNVNYNETKSREIRDQDLFSSRKITEIVKNVLPTEPPLFCFKPGTFRVILCVDNSETLGSGKRKKEMADKLSQSGIPIDTRKLQVGDFLWIAKENSGLERELVLDFIIERKRMDDLASSICDGRFKEQKFRLKNCGLLKLIYMVESYKNAKHLPIPEQSLYQSITNTQVIDGFFIKETDDLFHSAEYLKIMTNQLINLYKNKTLFAARMNLVKEIKKNAICEEVLQHDEQYLITFEEFSSQTDKNKVLLVKEMFVKHLTQIKGMSVDRALAIVKIYSTPSILVSAYENCSSESEKENLISSIQFGTLQRKIGNALSKQVYFVYSNKKS
ncbi:crossover junction endonuclease MUS81 isoform X2 [Hydra vulgaris]|uniref:Crossover junction endonuclease MUS81 n=1 Tax=Hydra vulgaris TaxID=6087 RepID=A0ABM4CJF6_HYDVU